MPNPYEGLLTPQNPGNVDPYSDPIPQIQALKEKGKFMPDAPGIMDDPRNYFQRMVTGNDGNFLQRGFDQVVDMLPSNPFELMTGFGAGTVKKTPKVVDFNAFKKTGGVVGRKGRPPKQEVFKASLDSEIPPSFESRGAARAPIRQDIENLKVAIDQAEDADDFGKVLNLESKLGDAEKNLYIENLRNRAVGQKRDKELAAIDRWQGDEIADEPYMGGFSSTAWGNKDQYYQFPIPAKNVDVQGHMGKRVAQGGLDPFAWVDSKNGFSKKILQEHAGKPLKISTRSDLISHDDYMENLVPGLHKVDMHLPPVGGIRAMLEPGDPSFNRRIEAANKLLENGQDVTLVIDRFDNLPDQYNLNVFDNKALKAWVKKGGKIRENKAGKLPAKLINDIRESEIPKDMRDK